MTDRRVAYQWAVEGPEQSGMVTLYIWDAAMERERVTLADAPLAISMSGQYAASVAKSIAGMLAPPAPVEDEKPPPKPRRSRAKAS